MSTGQLFGLLRSNSGIRRRTLEAATVGEVLRTLEGEGFDKKELAGCIILVNGKTAGKRHKLAGGDTVVLMSAVAGG